MKLSNMYIFSHLGESRRGVRLLAASFLLFAGGVGGSLLMTSCSDTWDEHYDENRMPSDQTLLDLVSSDSELSDFLKVLKSAHLYNNNHSTPITYAELLGADQSLTVWAPKNGTFDCDSLIKQCMTQQGDSMVGQHFLGNHIAHTLYTAETDAGKSVLMMNNKQVTGRLFDVIQNKSNQPAKNGLLHVVGQEVPYNYNIYEGITSMSDFAHIGKFFKGFETHELDENASIQRGIEDGMKVYSDSVMVKKNILYNRFGLINHEDSCYFMLMPTAEVWDDVIKEAAPYFNYGSVLKADSISNYWMNSLLLQASFYNRNIQTYMADSIYSTWYSRMDPEYNVFYRPLDQGGVLSDEFVKDSLECSNGMIYTLKKWPFTKEQLYFRPIEVEPEYSYTLLENKDCTFNYRQAVGDSVSSHGYLDIVPAKSTSNWTAKFRIENTLAGTYDICAIILPKTVYNPNSRDVKPNKFKATLTYTDLQGNSVKEDYPQGEGAPKELENNPYCVDTVVIGRVSLPVCNYAQNIVTVNLQINCSIANRETKFSREMFLDCIYFRPVTDEKSPVYSSKKR